MKKLFIRVFIMITLMAWGCKEKSHEKDMHEEHNPEAADAVDISENQVLYNEVMKIHDEVMPKMEDMHKRKEALKKKLAESNLSAEQKKQIQSKINQLDSAGESMMVWMREFNPIPDSAGEEKAREYLEGEMEKVKEVRENILAALKETDA
jgi:hypothetical protein